MICSYLTHSRPTEQETMANHTLDELSPGQRAIVKKIRGTGPIRRRLMDMGMVNGAEVEMLKTAPLGDPIEYKLQGYHLSLRKTEAKNIEVEA